MSKESKPERKRCNFSLKELNGAAFQKSLTRQQFREAGSQAEDFRLGEEELRMLGSLKRVVEAETYIRETHRPNTE